MKTKLLTRDEFRRAVFARDKHCCVICGVAGVGDEDDRNYTLDAHHILERRLFVAPEQFGGYFIENGATLCTEHHLMAEQTVLSCQDIREAVHIDKVILPEHLYDDQEYTKWGDIIQPNGMRLRGELFYDESVQAILAEGKVLNLYSPYVKYPRTYHLPWSNPSKDDKVIRNLESFVGQEVVVTEKMDGENSNLYNDHFHARSLSAATGQDRGMVKALWGRIKHEIPDGWRFCGENVYAKHSILYTQLESYFYLFSIWNERNECLSWDETLEWAELLNLSVVPILYRGVWNEDIIRGLYEPIRIPDAMEGYVVRLTSSFSYREFPRSVAKFVRENHVTTDNHWRHQKLVPNSLL